MELVEKLAVEIDEAMDNGDKNSLLEAIKTIDIELLRAPDARSAPILNYCRANAYSALKQLNLDYKENPFGWQQPEVTEEILSLRRARKSEAFSALDIVRRAQILTNLGNALNTVGRSIDAVSSWDEAIELIPEFAMAAGNRAYGLTTYSAGLYDSGHQCIFLSEAQKGYQGALSPNAFWDSGFQSVAADQFATKLDEIMVYLAQHCQLDNFDPYDFDLGQTDEERRFNQWRLENKLFLNPLNDLGSWPVAGQDVFHLPSHTYAIGEEPRFVKFFDLLKQEFATACVLLWEGRTTGVEEHHADKSSLMFEHHGYSVSSIGIEKQKAALRLAYSLLDKTAVFINDFFKLGKDPNRVSFRNVWFSDRACTQLHTALPVENWRLRGLFSLSLDVYDKDLKVISSPLAARANDVRNATEHRFLSVHEFGLPDDRIQLCEYVTKEELYELGLHILRLARSAIMGLSLTVHHHEKTQKDDDDKNIVPTVSLPRRRFRG